MKEPLSSAHSQSLARYQPIFPIRIITAASLFDGHDAAINIMRRILQASGAEVIHLGHNRAALEIVEAAIQEDAQAIAISSYQGGHVEYFKYIVDLLKERGFGHIKVFGGGGGTITPDEIEDLHKYGVTRLYSPEDGRTMGLQGLIDDMLKNSDAHPLTNVDWKKLKNWSSDNRALSQAITCLEWAEDFDKDYSKHKKDFTPLLSPKAKSPIVIGLTGTGGAGKSSLTDEIILRLLEHDSEAKIGVLAIDPTRRKTGGALLGDRLRMNSLSNERCYMRSLATRKAHRAVSEHTENALNLMKGCDFDWIFLETGGIGQADSEITDFADINLYVMTSEYGASTQLEKINMLDFADMVVINKFDKPGSLDALADVRKQFRRNHLEFEKLPPETYPVFATTASIYGDPGVNQLVDHLLSVKDRDNKRQPLAQTLAVTEQKALVPAEHVSYLADIAKTVRDYKKKTADMVEDVRQAEALHISAANSALPDKTRNELKGASEEAHKKLDPEVEPLLEEFQKEKERYEKDNLSYKVRDKTLEVPLALPTLSHSRLRRVVPPDFESRTDILKFMKLENLPGKFPFTAGVFPLKRLDEEPKRMFAGEGGPHRTNKRFHFLCKGEKTQRLSTAFDSVTLYGDDPAERPDIFGKIGESGVSIATLDDAKALYDGFDLCSPKVSVSMTINGPAPILLAFFFNTAIDQQVERFKKENKRDPNEEEHAKIKAHTLSQVRGTVQADILKEDQAQNTCIFSSPFAMRLMGDIQQFFIENNVRNFYSVSISGYHIAEAGANPITQLALTLANGFTYVEYYRARGMAIDHFAPNLSFFFSNGLDAEYTVIGRVARRIWAIAMRDLYGANERSQKLKYHIQTSGRSLHAQEIAFNDIRTTLQALLAFSDHCNSLHTNAYDEAITTPTTESVRRAMAIQMIIAREFGFNKNENPLQGSFFVDELTELVEEAVLEEFERISMRGGVLGAMEHQYQRNKIQEESLYYEKQKHTGELPIIGVNTFVDSSKSYEDSLPDEITRASYDEKNDQIKRVKDFQKRHAKESPGALAALKKAVLSGTNTFEALMDAARVCSLGQISQALYDVGGRYRRSS